MTDAITVLDKGFVRLESMMGGDQAVTRAARVSYKSPSEETFDEAKERKAHAKANETISKMANPKAIVKLKSLSSLVKEADTFFSLFIRMRDKKIGACRVCGLRPIQQTYHIIPRGKKGVRWSQSNAVGSCSGCNFFEHHNRLDVAQMWRERLGAKYDELWARGKSKTKYSRDELKLTIDYYKAMLAGEKPAVVPDWVI